MTVWTWPSIAVRALHLQDVVRRGDRDDPRQVPAVGREVAVGRVDHVAGLKAGLLGRAAGKHPGDLDSPDTIGVDTRLFFNPERTTGAAALL